MRLEEEHSSTMCHQNFIFLLHQPPAAVLQRITTIIRVNKLSTDLQLQVKYHVSCMTFLLGRYFELCCLDLHYQSSRVYVDHLVASFPSFADRRREDGAIFPFAWSCSLATPFLLPSSTSRGPSTAVERPLAELSRKQVKAIDACRQWHTSNVHLSVAGLQPIGCL